MSGEADKHLQVLRGKREKLMAKIVHDALEFAEARLAMEQELAAIDRAISLVLDVRDTV